MRKAIFFYNLTIDYIPWIYKFFSDRAYLKFVYRIKVNKKLDLDNPRRFNEKLQWLKLYDRRPEYTQMVDKYLVRDYIAKKIGAKYLIPLLGVWDSVEEINFSNLPMQFVLKCNHDSQGLVICKDKNKLNIELVKQKLKKALKKNFYYLTKEWPYKNVKPKIIAEKYMEDDSGELKDYKVLCFNGEPKIIEVHRGRFEGNHTEDNYDIEWNKTEINQKKSGLPTSDEKEEKPEVLPEMLSLSKKLAYGISHVRIDWYIVKNKLYFGEITFFDGSGFDEFEPDKWNEIMGDWINLESIKEKIKDEI